MWHYDKLTVMGFLCHNFFYNAFVVVFAAFVSDWFSGFALFPSHFIKHIYIAILKSDSTFMGSIKFVAKLGILPIHIEMGK